MNNIFPAALAHRPADVLANGAPPATSPSYWWTGISLVFLIFVLVVYYKTKK